MALKTAFTAQFAYNEFILCKIIVNNCNFLLIFSKKICIMTNNVFGEIKLFKITAKG